MTEPSKKLWGDGYVCPNCGDGVPCEACIEEQEEQQRRLARPTQCEHHVCRCIRADELAMMGMTAEAVDVHSQKVRCRQEEP